MSNSSAIRGMAHTNKHRLVFSFKSTYRVDTITPAQHDIARKWGGGVTWLHSPASLEILLLERRMKYREAQRGGGILGIGAELSRVSAVLVALRATYAVLSGCIPRVSQQPPPAALRVDRLACMIVKEHVCVPVSLCVCVFVLCWEQEEG